MMTKEWQEAQVREMLQDGYHRFSPGPFDDDFITDKYQKAFTDDTGTKYFITASASVLNIHGKNEYGIEYEVYFSDIETDNPVRILFYAGWEKVGVENRAEKMFASGDWRYYEKR